MNELEKYGIQANIDHQVNGKWLHQPELKANGLIVYKEKTASYQKGFDAAIALDLPVKFAKWQKVFRKEEEKRVSNLDFPERKEAFKQMVEFLTNEEKLYRYWLDNVLKLE